MTFRHAKKPAILCSAVLLCAAALFVGVFRADPANASTLTSSDGYTGVSTQGTVAAQTPYSSGQIISVDVATNPTMNSTSLSNAGFPGGAVPIKFLECADPNGTTANLPTKPSECEPGTIQTISGAAADGSMHLDGSNGYTILDLPDPNLGSSNGNTCDIAPNACVIGIFSNQNDFSKPHLFSSPFQVASNGGADDGSNPGDGTSAANVPPTITSANSTTFTTRTLGSFQVTASGFPGSSFSETGALPSGVTFSSSGLLSGTTTQTGNFPVTISASNGNLPDASQAFILSVVSTLTSADGFTAISTQGAVAGQTPYSSGQVVSVQVAANPTLNQTSLSNAGYPSGAVPIKLVECADPGGTTANLPTTPSQCEPQTVDTISGAHADGSTSLTGSGGYEVLDLPDPNLGASPITCDVAPNACVIGIFADQNDFSKPHLFSAPFQVASNAGADDGSNPGDGTSSANTPPTITSANATTFTAGAFGSFQVTASGFPGSSFSEAGALPSGVTFSSSGLLSGTTDQTGSFPITISASNGSFPNGTQSFTLTVGGTAPAAPTITSANNTTFTRGTAGTFTVTASGSPASTFSETGSLPGGVTLSTAGVLSGTPTSSGSFPITISASNGVLPNATQAFTLTVDAPPTITSANNTTFTQGTAGTFTVTATGVPAPTFSETGSLPSGVTLSTAGVLSGTPTSSGSFPITITASNGVPPNATQAFTLTVNAAPTITSANHTAFTNGVAGSFTVTAPGKPAPTFSETGPLPGGVTLSSAGVLSGTPNVAGTLPQTFTFTITASNGVSPNGTQSFTLTVQGLNVTTTSPLPNARIGQAYSFQLQAQGGTPPYKWKKTTSLPKGLKLSSSGLISGTPKTKVAPGTYTVGVSVTDHAKPKTSRMTATASFSLTVTS